MNYNKKQFAWYVLIVLSVVLLIKTKETKVSSFLLPNLHRIWNLDSRYIDLQNGVKTKEYCTTHVNRGSLTLKIWGEVPKLGGFHKESNLCNRMSSFIRCTASKTENSTSNAIQFFNGEEDDDEMRRVKHFKLLYKNDQI